MVLEIVQIDIKADCEEAFEAMAERATALVQQSYRYSKLELVHCSGLQTRYFLLVHHDAEECTSEKAISLSNIEKWLKLVTPFLCRKPRVQLGLCVMQG